MAIALLYWFVSLACWGYALRFGGRAGLWAFLLFLVMTLGTWFSTPPNIDTWRGLNVPLFAADTSYFVGLTLLALTSRRYWPIWSAGFALMAVLTHFGPLLDNYTSPKIYRGLASVWELPILATMVLGIAKDRKSARNDILPTADPWKRQ